MADEDGCGGVFEEEDDMVEGDGKVPRIMP